MRYLYLASLLATTVSLSASQAFVPTSGTGSFPACAAQCPVLLQAQTICTPPNAITSTQLNYENCFCQSPTLQDLYTTGETRCVAQCTTAADRQLLSTWFVGFCKQVGQGIDPVGGSKTTLATVTTGTTEATAGATTVITLNSGSSGNSGPWIQTHWQWLIMLLVLFFGLLGLGLGARWLKKRHDQKMDQKRATMSGFPVTDDKRVDRDRALSPELWGPHQHMAATEGYQYTSNGATGAAANGTSKSKANRSSRVEVTEFEESKESKPRKTSKLRPW